MAQGGSGGRQEMNTTEICRDTEAQCRIGFIMEQGLGHVTHIHGLQSRVVDDPQVDAVWMLVPYHADDIWEKLPPMSIKMGLRARKMLRRAVNSRAPDCLFFHTQVLSLFNYDFITRIPSVISLDATPLDFNTIESSYAAKTARGGLGQLKHAWYRRVFKHAAGIVAFSDWVRISLINDYGVAAEKIRVIPSGIDLEHWQASERKYSVEQKIRLLFVGGDFSRKGGDELLAAYRDGLAEHCELDIVTRDKVTAAEPEIRVHTDLNQGMPALKQLFADADIFILPSRGDASPFVVLEAMAAGLPVISTRVGAVEEQVVDDVTGYLMVDNSPATIRATVLRMIENRNRMLEMGRAGRELAEEKFNAQTNYHCLLEYLKEIASCART